MSSSTPSTATVSVPASASVSSPSQRAHFVSATRDFVAAMRELGVQRVHLWPTWGPGGAIILVRSGTVAERFGSNCDPPTTFAEAWDETARLAEDAVLLETLY